MAASRFKRRQDEDGWATLRRDAQRAEDKIANVKAAELDEDARLRELHSAMKYDPSLQLTESDLGAGLTAKQLQRARGMLPGQSQKDMLLPEEREFMNRFGKQKAPMMERATPRGGLGLDDLAFDLEEDSDQGEFEEAPRRMPIREQQRIQAPPRALQRTSSQPAKQWSIVEYDATVGGQPSVVYKVEHYAREVKLDKVFRMREIAAKIAHVLNETNNIMHPKVIGLVTLHDRRVVLQKQLRQISGTAESRRTNLAQIKKLREQLVEIDMRLGV